MGAVQSDLKASIVQASSGGNVIAPDDNEFWSTYWARPETAEHVFETFTASDIRCMRDSSTACANLRTLIVKVAIKLLHERHFSLSLSEHNESHGLAILNCIRILTRILPYVYESEEWQVWENTTFWQPSDLEAFTLYDPDVAAFLTRDTSLGAQLAQALTDLLFYTGFTLPWPDSEAQALGEAKVSYGLWQSGIACDATVITSREYESRRTEILQLLLTWQSKCIYLSPQKYIVTEIPATTCIVRHCSKRRIQSLLCSLLNTICKYHPETWLPFDPRSHLTDSAVRDRHVRMCLHFLLVSMLNRAPWDDNNERDKNEFRLQFSYLHTPKHFQFLADGLSKVLRQPLEVNANVLSLGQRPFAWASEMILLLWEALRINRKFLHYIIESGRALDFTVLLVFYARQSHMEGIGRVCTFCLQTLSAGAGYGQALNKPFDAQSTLPMSIQIKNFHGTYADFLILSILSILGSSAIDATHWSGSLLVIVKNVAPDIQRMARTTSSRLLQLFARKAKPATLLASENNIDMVTHLLEAINVFVEVHGPERENANLLLHLWRARDKIESLRVLTQMDDDELSALTSTFAAPNSGVPSSAADEPVQGEKQRGKQPLAHGNFPPNMKRKLANLPLAIAISVIDDISARVFSQLDTHAPASAVSEDSRRSSIISLQRDAARDRDRDREDASSKEVLALIRESNTLGAAWSENRNHQTQQLHTPEPFCFEPTIASLYASYYWGVVISQDMQRASETGKGVWFGTKISLFGVRAGQVQGPSFWSPKGAVDAVGESLIAGVRDLTMRAKRSISSEAS